MVEVRIYLGFQFIDTHALHGFGLGNSQRLVHVRHIPEICHEFGIFACTGEISLGAVLVDDILVDTVGLGPAAVGKNKVGLGYELVVLLPDMIGDIVVSVEVSVERSSAVAVPVDKPVCEVVRPGLRILSRAVPLADGVHPVGSHLQFEFGAVPGFAVSLRLRRDVHRNA